MNSVNFSIRDDEMDGEWEAALINNPKCADAPGCGEWKPSMIDNPNYKGKWRPPMIDNPNYRGKWKPRTIPNPEYFEDLEPFKMRPIVRNLNYFCFISEIWIFIVGVYVGR